MTRVGSSGWIWEPNALLNVVLWENAFKFQSNSHENFRIRLGLPPCKVSYCRPRNIEDIM